LRYFIQFSYFGKAYHGWQKQPNAITVQEVLEDALSKLLREEVITTGAGRTDAGVHAKIMYAHFDIAVIKNPNDLVYRLNAFLPDDIAVQNIIEVGPEAHARFDATQRTYEYWIYTEKNPFYKDASHYIYKKLDLSRMNQGASLLIGKKDFECFSKSNTDVNTYFCTIKEAIWFTDAEKLIFRITADRFLRNMVRAVVGTLVDVGSGKYEPDYVNTIINSKDRSKAGVSVPAKGLYLTSIVYPNTIIKNG
jgi:tRNA pseudouridine38-40 synthase